MKKISIVLSVFVSMLFAVSAYADTCGAAFTSSGLFNSFQAAKLCSSFATGLTVSEVPSTNNSIDLGTSAKAFRTEYLGTNLVFTAASAKIIPGATSLLIRNNADNATNISILDAGAATFRSTVNSTGLQFPTTSEEAVAGAGTTVADAAALSATKHVHQITGANGTVGWVFAASVAGQFEILLNTTAGVPKVYANTGGTCNGGGANAACTLVTGIVAHLCYSTAVDTWICA